MVLKNGMDVKSLLFLLMWLCCQVLPGQSYIADVRKISMEDGLSNRFVNKIYKDSRGFMWIATDYGLNRYDGYRFKLYTSENSALSSSIIRDIHEDDQHRLWVVEQGVPYMLNISILDLKTGNIQSFDEVFEGISSFKGIDHIHMYAGPGNSLWITTREGKVYRYQSKRFEHIVTLPEKEPAYILYADNRLLWIKTPSGEIRVNTKKGPLEEYNAQHNAACTYMGHDKNSFWRFQPREKRLLRFTGEAQDPQSIDLQPLDLPEAVFDPGADITRVFHSGAANELLWLYQRKNDSSYLFVLQPEKGTILDVKSKTKALYTHGQFYARSIYFETDNRAWISTADGIFIITLKKNKFNTLLSDGVEGYSVRGITEDSRGVFYFNAYGSIVSVLPETGVIKKYKAGNVWLGAHRDRQGNLWFADSKNNIEKYDPVNGQSQYYTSRPDATGYDTSSQWAIVRDTTGVVWTGTSRGLYSLDPKTGRYERFTRYNEFSQLGESVVYYLVEEEKNIWIASSSGLYLLEPGKGITRRYSGEEKKPYYIPYNHLLHFYRDTTGIFWMATIGGGLIRSILKTEATGNLPLRRDCPAILFMPFTKMIMESCGSPAITASCSSIRKPTGSILILRMMALPIMNSIPFRIMKLRTEHFILEAWMG